MPAPKKPLDVLNANRAAALRYAEKGGASALKRLLTAAQDDLVARLGKVRGDKDTFTAAQMQTTLRHVQQLLADVKRGLGKTVLDTTKATAMSAAKGTIEYVEATEAQFRGMAVRPLALNSAMVFDRMASGTESSVLNRLLTQPDAPQRPGILDRYGDAVVQRFEQKLALRLVAGKPWAETRQELIDESEFLQGAPMSWAERIVRTETMHAHNTASLTTMVSIDEMVGGGSVKILCATFDNRTSADSYAVHGQIRRLSEPFDWWGGRYMVPPNRPNDREVVVPHRIEWPLPKELTPKTDAEVAAAWAKEGRKGVVPARPNMSTIPREQFGKEPEPTKPLTPPVAPPVVPPVATPQPKPKAARRRPPDASTAQPTALPAAPPAKPTTELPGMRALTPGEEKSIAFRYGGEGDVPEGTRVWEPIVKGQRLEEQIELDREAMERLDEFLDEYIATKKIKPTKYEFDDSQRHWERPTVMKRVTADEVRTAMRKPEKDREQVIVLDMGVPLVYRGGATLAADATRASLKDSFMGNPAYASSAVVVNVVDLKKFIYEKSPVRAPGTIAFDEAERKTMLKRTKFSTGVNETTIEGRAAMDVMQEAAIKAGYQPKRGLGYGISTVPDGSLGENVAGRAEWSGAIKVIEKQAKQAPKFLTRQPTTHLMTTSERQAVVEEAGAFRTYVHEVIHTCSPLRMGGYERHGAVLEEVCTELNARRHIDNLLEKTGAGLTVAEKRAGMIGVITDGRASYQTIIDEVSDILTDAIGSTNRRDGRHLAQRAADHLWRRRGLDLGSADKMLDAFLESVDATTTVPISDGARTRARARILTLKSTKGNR